LNAFITLLRKEALDIVRDLRLSIFALVYTILTGLIAFFFLRSTLNDQAAGQAPIGALIIVVPLGILNLLFHLILAGTFVLDAVGRERDEGMLGLLLTTRAAPGSILVAKLAMGLMVYVALGLFALAIAAVMGASLGLVVPEAILLAFLGPLLVLFVFLMGSGLLLSVILPTARVAVAVGIAIHLVLFIIGATPIFSLLTASSPILTEAIKWTPFAVAAEGESQITGGGAVPWAHDLATIAVGIACFAIAWFVFRRKEVAQG
jgi:ABC-type transport system involved in multi-copper enzyme maturation permease subunit